MTGFAKRGKFCQLLWLLSTIANRKQFFYIWYQRLFEFLEDAGRRSNTIAPRTWLRYTDNDKVKGSFYKKKTWSVWRRAHGWTIRPNRLLWRPFRGFSFLSQLVSLVPASYIKKMKLNHNLQTSHSRKLLWFLPWRCEGKKLWPRLSAKTFGSLSGAPLHLKSECLSCNFGLKWNLFQNTVSEFWLRGLCPSSKLDTVYKLRQDVSEVNKQFLH